MWRRIAARDPAFGRPDKFCSQPELSNWMSATVTTLDDKIPPYVQRICQRDPFSGKVVTGGIVTARDSNWLLSWTFNRQPQFRDQPRGQLVGWIYGLFSDKPGNFVKKPMRECTGREICMEWLYHMGVPEGEIAELAAHSANTVPCMMPYITAFFLPRAAGDRPRVVPDGGGELRLPGAVCRDGAGHHLTTEYSMRTGMEAVYTLLDIDRGVPEVWGSTYDVRDLINASVQLRDGRKLTELELNPAERLALKAVLKKAPWHRPGEAAPGLPRHLTRPAPALSKSAGAGARQKGLLNASGRFKRLFIDGTASTGAAPTGSCPPFSGGPGRGRCR